MRFWNNLEQVRSRKKNLYEKESQKPKQDSQTRIWFIMLKGGAL